MLGKLLRHEFKETARFLLPLNLILIAVTLIGAILLGTRFLQNDTMELLAVTCMMFYILCIFALFVITGVFLTVRFYKTMYADQGYLTHTLPVKTASLVNAKIVISILWLLVSYVITIVSVLLLIWVTVGGTWSPAAFLEFESEMTASLGMGVREFLVCIAAMLVLASIQIILMLFSSLSVGQLFRQRRILASVGTFFVFYILQQLAGMMMLFLLGFQTVGQMASDNYIFMNPGELYRNMLLSGMLISAVFCVGYFIACHYITDKYLNLE